MLGMQSHTFFQHVCGYVSPHQDDLQNLYQYFEPGHFFFRGEYYKYELLVVTEKL
jgi:hypothetical protein